MSKTTFSLVNVLPAIVFQVFEIVAVYKEAKCNNVMSVVL